MEQKTADDINQLDLGEIIAEVEGQGDTGDDSEEGNAAGDSGNSRNAEVASQVAGCISWDFRDGNIPAGIEVVGEYEMVTQRDGSTAIALSARSFISVMLQNVQGVNGKLVNNYTLTMDVKLDSLPAESLALLQTKADSSRATEGEAFIYKEGGVGVFGEVGVADNAVQADKWVRVCITLGPAPPPPPPSRGRGQGGRGRGRGGRFSGGQGRGGFPMPGMGGGMGGMDMERAGTRMDNESEDEDEEDYIRRSIMGGAGAGGERMFTTYVNSKKCAVISSHNRGVVGMVDGRMALNPVGFNLFQSSNLSSMPGGIQVRYIELNYAKCLPEAEIKKNAQKNRIFSTYERDKQAQLQAIRTALTLAGVYRKPPPMWLHPCTLCAFGDVYLDNTGLTGGNDVCTSATILALTIERLLLHRSERTEGSGTAAAASSSAAGGTAGPMTLSTHLKSPNILGEFAHDSLQSVSYLLSVLKALKTLATPYALAAKNGGPQVVHFMKKMKKQLEGLTEGGSLFLPGGIGSARPILFVVEKESSDSYRFVVINTDPTGGLDCHLANAESAPKIKYQTIIVVKDVTHAKITDDAFWGMIYKLALLQPDKFNRPDVLYEVLLPFLADKPLEQILHESELEDGVVDYKTPQRSSTAAYRCTIHGCFYLLRRKGLSAVDVKKLFFAFKLQMIHFIQHDLQFIRQIHDSDRRVIKMTCQQLSYNAAKLGGQDHISVANLNYVYYLADSIIARSMEIECIDENDSGRLPNLQLITTVAKPANDRRKGSSGSSAKGSSPPYQIEHPYMDRLLRTDDVDGLAGVPVITPKYVPIDYLQLPTKVEDLEDAVAAIRHCDRLCTLIMVQGHCVKNQSLHIVSLVQYVMTQLLPIPKPNMTVGQNAGEKKCIWNVPMRYGLQLDLCIVLERILEHFMGAAFSLHPTKSLDALKLVIPACVATFVDCLLRKVSTDQPSDFCLHLIGKDNAAIPGGRGVGYGLNLDMFGRQSETIEMHTPELCVARTAVIDYFDSQTSLTKIFNWEVSDRLEETVVQFLAGICRDVAFPVSEGAMVEYMTKGNALINKNYPEFHIYRNVAFYMKYVQNVDPRAFPPKSHYVQQSAELQWAFQQGQFMVGAFVRGFLLKCYPSPPFDKQTHRYPSAAHPSFLATPHEIGTEDDVLHIKNLPSFDDCLGQQDAELLLSYLTVPYIRVPLVLSMFSTEDRIHALKSETLQQVLDSVLFEPSKYLPINCTNTEPKYVPSENKKLLATPHGLLLNELHRSPEVVIKSVLQLIKLALGVDVGSVHSNTVPIILYVFRLATRVESFVIFVIQYHLKTHPALSDTVILREVDVLQSVLEQLQAGLADIRELMYDKAHGLLDAWNVQLMAEVEKAKETVSTVERMSNATSAGKSLVQNPDERPIGGSGNASQSSSSSMTGPGGVIGEMKKAEMKDESGKIIDRNTIIACQLHAHLLLIYRNTAFDELSADIVSTISSSVSFLTTRHTWNMNLLGIPEHEIFEMLSVQRRNLVQYSRKQCQSQLNELLESVVRVSVGIGVRSVKDQKITASSNKAGMLSADGNRKWGHVKGNRNVGRFSVASVHRSLASATHASAASGPPPEIDDSVQELGIEIDLQLFQITLKSSHLQALDTVIASNPDVQLIFKSSKSMQASVVQSTENRQWVHLIGRGHDIQYWCTPDDRTCLQLYDRDYAPGDVFESEEWIVPILEPVRLTYMTEPFVLQICMQEHPLPRDAEVAHLVGIHPKAGGTWKEILVHRHTKMVQVYHVLSHGRRFYRVLEYTSDSRMSLREMQPSYKNRGSPWPPWERYGSNSHPYSDHWGDTKSCVITRTWEFPENLSGGTETYIPARLLYGIVPQVLLDNFLFWQDEDDNLRGYPTSSTLAPVANKKKSKKAKEDEEEDDDESEGDTSNKAGKASAPSSSAAVASGTSSFSPYLIFITLKSTDYVKYSAVSGVVGQIRRLMLKSVESRMKIVLELVDVLDNCTIIDKENWVIDFKLFKAAQALVNSFLPEDAPIDETDAKLLIETTKLFVEAITNKGKPLVMYSFADALLHDVYDFIVAHLLGGGDCDTAIASIVALKTAAAAPVAEAIASTSSASGGMSFDDLLAPSASAEPATVVAEAAPERKLAKHNLALRANKVVRSAPASSGKLPVDQVDLVLVNLANAYKEHDGVCENKFGSIVKALTRVENAGHILCWTRTENVGKCITDNQALASGADSGSVNDATLHVDLVEIPRLKVSFEEKLDSHGVPRLYSMDHVNLYISNNTPSSSMITAKLMKGMPHSLLMSTNNFEYQILVPVIDVVRPIIGSNPFTTELVMNRNENPEWYAALDTCYYLYNIHVSLAFLFSTTLASSLYLLSLRFLHRQYDEVFRLADTIGTDSEFTVEERNIFYSLGRLQNDCHPDAHACRLKISLVTMDAPIECPWDLTKQCSKYITKLSHISAVCRISFEDELQLLELCVCDSKDPRFYDPETEAPKYSVYEVTLVKNRKYYLRAMMDQTFIAETFLPPRFIGTSWPLERNNFALMADDSTYMALEVNYAVPPAVSGHAVFQMVDKFYTRQEDMAGTYSGGLGFLFLYELLTGSKHAKIMDKDISVSLATILFQFMSDKSVPSLLPSIISLLIHHPLLRELFPKFVDNRQTKNRTIKGMGDDLNPISPLATVLGQSLQIVQSQLMILLTPHPNAEVFGNHPSCYDVASKADGDSNMCPVMAVEDREWIIPNVSDYACSKRVLSEVAATSSDAVALEASKNKLVTSATDLQHFASQPIQALDLSKYITEITRNQSKQHDVSTKLPFDVSAHGQSKSVVALSMLQRLKNDMEDFANAQNNSKIPKLISVSNSIYDKMRPEGAAEGDSEVLVMTEAAAADIKASYQFMQTLIAALEALRAYDEEYSLNALSWLSERVNHVRDDRSVRSGNASADIAIDSSLQQSESGDGNGTAASKDTVLFMLKRISQQEVTLWLEIVFSTLLSSRQTADLQQLNPFLGEAAINEVTDVTVSTILHANRVGQINRCLLDARDVSSILGKLVQGYAVGATVPNTFIASAILKSESLANNLVVGRHYIESSVEASAAAVEYTYDPRFLLFEFTWNILLRKSQVRMVRDYIKNINAGQSAVKQMIMGAGKTTVVCPLLTLLLGDGKNLVVQVVPPALLEFSRSVMRSTFSSIMHKRIYTLTFDRSTEVNPAMYRKLQSSVTTRGVVICTPTTVKSIMLKFVELMDMIRDNSQRHSIALEKDCQELGRTLQLFQDSVLIMDEVDLILHPLKSELNFPIGPKEELDASPRRWLLPIHIIDSIFYAERNKMAVNFKQSVRAENILKKIKAVIQSGYQKRALQRNPHLILLNVDWYHAKMKPVMIEWVYLWLESQHIATVLSSAQVYEYIMTDTAELSSGTCPIATMVSERVPEEHRKALNLSRNWMNSYLPHVLTKIDRVSFGIMNKGDYERAIKEDPHMPRTRAKLAIPFVGKDVPSRSSEFAHPDVIIGLTVMAYRYEGLRWTDFEDVVANLRSTLTKEMGPWHARKSSLRFQKWIEEAGGRIKGSAKGKKDTAAAKSSNPDDALLSVLADSVGLDLASSAMPPPPPAEETAASSSSCGEEPTATAGTDDDTDKEVVSLRLLKRSNDEQMSRIFELIHMLPDALHFYLENFIFPVYMDNKITKLSAAGQELGGDMLFKRRIGFSGTPSDLLPVELGRCEYEKGSDGQMIHVMTSTKVCSYEVIQERWSPMSILQMIANPGGEENANEGDSRASTVRYNALIDTGALITGMTNYEVARTLLYKCRGLASWCEGVVFLDEYDRKMILVKATGRVLKLQQCGIPADKRFAFYDQVHTTGMDISHVINAKAILTLSKDMVFRDFAQGAYRMRGIAKGQTIHIMVIPEVRDLIVRELKKCGPGNYTVGDWKVTKSTNSTAGGGEASCGVLQDITAWLIVNSMRTERVQYNLLCLQNTSNIWRKIAYNTLLKRRDEFKVNSIAASGSGGDPLLSSVDSKLCDQLDIFCEPIPFALECDIPKPVSLADCIDRKVRDHKALIPLGSEKEEGAVAYMIRSWVTGSHLLGELAAGGAGAGAAESSAAEAQDLSGEAMDEVHLGAEMVQEQEQEKEQQQEQEQEQEIEIEKYVDLAYSREHEEPTPWLFSSLGGCSGDIDKCDAFVAALDQFYPAAVFKLYKRKPLAFPGHLHVSNNYFDKRWSGARRIKNLVVVLEYVPSPAQCAPHAVSFRQCLSEQQDLVLDTALSLFENSTAGGHEGGADFTLEEVAKIIKAFCHVDVKKDLHLVGPVLTQRGLDMAALCFVDTLKDLLLSGAFNQVERGRHFVAISLAEAETIRRIMHVRKGQSVIANSSATLALRCQVADNVVLDQAMGFAEASVGLAGTPCPYTTTSAYECFRYLNCDMFFSEPSINAILRALFRTSRHERRSYYKQILGCRRRLTKKWNDAPVTKLFTLKDHYNMLKQRALSVTIRNLMVAKSLQFYDAFIKFDFDRNGHLSPGEVWGGLQYLGLDSLEAQDVLDFITFADVDRDGNISYKEFVDVLFNPLCEDDEALRAAGAAGGEGGEGGGEGGGGAGESGGEYFPNSLSPYRRSSSSSSSLSAVTSATSSSLSISIPLKKQVSLTCVRPVGEEELKALQYTNQKEEEREERLIEAEEGEEERRIRRELEEEEILQDLAQEGGQNPKVNEDSYMLAYSFKTGKLPRHVATRGDFLYKPDHEATAGAGGGGAGAGGDEEAAAMSASITTAADGSTVYFMKVLPSAMLFLSLPPVPSALPKAVAAAAAAGAGAGSSEESSSKPQAYIPGGVGSLGGSGTNVYTAVMEVMFDKLPAGPTSGAPAAADAACCAVPIFNPAGYGEREALLWLHPNGAVTLSATNPSTAGGAAGSSSSSLPRLQPRKWFVLTLVVDCGHSDGSVTLYVNDSESACRQFTPPGIDQMDNEAYSIVEQRVTMFGTRDAKACQGGNLRSFTILPRALIAPEVSELVRGIIRDSNSNMHAAIATQLMGMGFNEDIARWAAASAAGDTLEERVMNALNVLS